MNSIKKLLSGSDKFVALTFDDGPSYSKINNILDALEKHESKATFFVLGGRINARTFNVIEKIHKAGHELGNHSWSHRKLTSLSSEEQMQELDKTNLAIKSITKEDVK
ncbi:polysaccharide deacetylase family protein [Wolbachia endosymbiont of Ctenocephalides felis wCfeT]|uniref:polysaccharide deacetylase family protein n=1 Tax=Wolbachia endosymbiont of Ctenocephalides felis wCfeT TaxID=2732593 RepID=UPI001FE81D12|nr:polysaccharide deacetylase family protein [Wolbachia endosymbiont of Ctenocephalides felis wCfeT]